jgi:hypothetical protein
MLQDENPWFDRTEYYLIYFYFAVIGQAMHPTGSLDHNSRVSLQKT